MSAVAALLLATPLLSGCTTGGTCISWVAYDGVGTLRTLTPHQGVGGP